MSGTAIVRELLLNTPAVTALVPAGQIRAGIVPQGAKMPAIGVHTISESEEGTIARGYAQKMIYERVQVTVYAKSTAVNPTDTDNAYGMLKRIMKAVALGAGVHTGVVLGFRVRSVMPWGVGPEIPPDDNKIYEQSRDFMVTFVEAN